MGKMQTNVQMNQSPDKIFLPDTIKTLMLSKHG